jgi:hypothetical protein
MDYKCDFCSICHINFVQFWDVTSVVPRKWQMEDVEYRMWNMELGARD